MLRTRAEAARRTLRRFNFGTVAAFLAWFGGTGYLLARYLRRLVPGRRSASSLA